MTPHHIKIAAEAFAAGLFAQAGYDVFVQYSADQPQYDLIVSNGQVTKKISVKGSQEGKWGLAQKYLTNANKGGYVMGIVSVEDRRRRSDRRKGDNSNYGGHERRSCSSRRSGSDRRQFSRKSMRIFKS